MNPNHINIQDLPHNGVSREHVVISSRSMWPDISWFLDSVNPGYPFYTICWHFELPDNSWSTDPQHFELLESFREVIWGMMKNGGWYGRTLKPASVAMYSPAFRSLFRWMVFNDLTSFGDLTPESLRNYLDELPFLISHGSSYFDADTETSERDELDEWNASDAEAYEPELVLHDDGDSATGGTASTDAADMPTAGDDDANEAEEAEEELACDKADDSATYHQVIARVTLFYLIYAQNHRLEERGFGVLKDVPFNGDKARKVLKTVTARTFNSTPPLPDEVALLLLGSAIAWVEHRAFDVMAVQEIFLSAVDRHLARGVQLERARLLARRELASYEFSKDPATGLPWRGPLEERIDTPPNSSSEGQGVAPSIATAMRYNLFRLRDAAMTILQYLVGIRPSEVCAIEAGMDEETGLPSCVLMKRSKSGLLELFYLRSLLSKGLDQPQPNDWLIGCRPAGAKSLPLTVQCLSVLQRVFEPWRALGNRSEMLVGFRYGFGLPTKPEYVVSMTTWSLNDSFKFFMRNEVDLSALPDESVRGENLIRYRESKGAIVTPRQGRKTFAAFMLESRASLLPAVKDHFKHLNVATTERAYYPQEARMRNDVDSVAISDTIAFFTEAVKGKKIVGRMAPVIKQYFGSEDFTNAKSPAELDGRIRHVVISHDLRIFFNDHGKCLIAAKPSESRCRQETGTANWENVTPDYAVRSPGMCAGCGAFAADRSNRPFWERRLEQYTKAHEAAQGKGREHEYHVHLARAQQAAQVIKWFDGAEIER